MSFDNFKLNKQLLNAVEEAGYKQPTEIQQKSIPVLLSGQDVIGIAQTGTGKTAAYVLPMLKKLNYAQGNSPRALILAPTRELALQIEAETKRLAIYTDLRITAVIGGKSLKAQSQLILDNPCDIIIATPRRIYDLYRAGAVWLRDVKTLIIDEADRMMDMGFMPQINRILEVVPTKRQNMLFSATLPPKIIPLIKAFLEYPVKIEITPESTPAKTISQLLYEVPNFRTKINLLVHLLTNEENATKVLIFTRNRITANSVAHILQKHLPKNSIKVIHANKDQNARINALNQLKEGLINYLVATDVAARGLDVTQVTHVFNFDIPNRHEEYVHRIGRTGRAGLLGKAISFANPAETYHIKKIEETTRENIKKAEIPIEVTVEETGFKEKQEIAKAIDYQKKKENPDYKGAFHEKKPRTFKNKNKTPAKSKPKNQRRKPNK